MTLLERRVDRLVLKADDSRVIHRSKTDPELDSRLEEIRKSIVGKSSLHSSLMAEALGIIAELARRVLEGQPVAYKCQLVTAVHLLQRRIVELPNGEGKTLACALAAAFTAYSGKPCHVATYNSYLARRDLLWMGPLYTRLGLKACAFLEANSVGFLEAVESVPASEPTGVEGPQPAGQTPTGLGSGVVDPAETMKIQGQEYRLRVIPGEARAMSQSRLRGMSVVYGTITDFIFRHLYDNLASSLDEVTFPELACLIIDECDFALIDSADQPHRIVATSYNFRERRLRELVPDLFAILSQLQRDTDYIPRNHFRLTPEGERKVREAFGWGPLLSEEHSGLAALIDEMLRGLYSLRADVDYVATDGQIKPIDKASGRPRSGSVFAFGTHQALMLKHHITSVPAGLEVNSQIQGEISVQHFVRSYEHVCGLSASAMWYSREFSDLYGLKTVEVKPQFPSRREDADDVTFWTRYEKFVSLIDRVLEANRIGQPVLVDCPDIRTAELIGQALGALDVEAFVQAHKDYWQFAAEETSRLNLLFPRITPTVYLDQVEQQFQRLAASNLQPELLTAKHLALEASIIAEAGRPGAVTISAKLAGRGTDIRVDAEADALGGLHVIGFDRNRSRHIDQQIRGRTGRQGHNGTSVFLLSMQDELMADALNVRWKFLPEQVFDQGMTLQNAFTNRSVEAAQRRITRVAARDRYETFRFDAVMDRHRAFLMNYRRGLLSSKNLVPHLNQMVRNIIVRNVDANLKSADRNGNSRSEALVDKLQALGSPVSKKELEAWVDGDNLDRTIAKFAEALLGALEAGVHRAGTVQFNDWLHPTVLLQVNAMWCRYLGHKQEIYDQLATAGALGLEAGVPFERYELELNRAYWREIALFEEQAVTEAFRLISEFDASGAQRVVRPQLPGKVETQESSRKRSPDAWVRFRPLAIRTVSLEMLREIASEAMAARDLLPVFGTWVVVAIASLVGMNFFDLQRLAEIVPMRSERAALFGFTIGPAVFCAATLLMGALPIMLFSGNRAFLAQPLRPPSFLLWLPFSILASAALYASGAVKTDVATTSLTYLVPVALLLSVNLLDPLKTTVVGIASFLFPVTLMGLVLVGTQWLVPSWLPFLGLCCTCATGFYTAYYFHNVLAKFWHVTLWSTQIFLLSLLVFYELSRNEVALNIGVVLIVVLLLVISNRRIAGLRFFVDVIDLSGSQPKPARHGIELPHKAIYLVTAGITVGIAGVLNLTLGLLGRLGLFPSISGRAEVLIWPIAAALVVANFLVGLRTWLWINKMLASRLLRELRLRYTVLQNSDAESDSSDRLAREFVSRFREIFFVSLCALLLVWAAELLAPRITGAPLQFPLGIAGFVILCSFFSDSLFMFFRRLLARIQVRNADQAMISPSFSGPQAIALKAFGSDLLERQRTILEDFWNAERTDKLLFLKQLLRLARNFGALPELRLTPGDLVMSILFRSFLLTLALGLAFQLAVFVPVRPAELRTWFGVTLAVAIALIVLVSSFEYRSLKRKESDAALAEGEPLENVLIQQDDILAGYRAHTRPEPEPKRGEMKTHVFLSYCRENQAEVRRLRSDLLAAGEAVWWDQDILPGSDWKLEIRKAMKKSCAVVLCLSKEAEARQMSGIYPEALDAIAALREYAPGSIFLIPVRLSECEIPQLEIDSTRTLDRLHHVDLFPEDKRSDGVAQLIKAIQVSPRHGGA